MDFDLQIPGTHNLMKNLLLFTFLILVSNIFTFASEPAVWTINTRDEVLKGDAKGVSIDADGTIRLAPKLSELYNTSQSYVWSSAVDNSGNVYLGTGSDGKIFKVDASGKGALFADTNELNVSAIAVRNNGEIYAGTSPDGKVYKINQSGQLSVFFEPKEKYIWSLAVFNDGSLAVGTGENGRIYRVKNVNATPESSLFFDTSDTHIISLAADRSGNLYAGTDGNGLVLRFDGNGKPFALLDSPLREIHSLKIADDGSVYALALSDAVANSAATTTPTPTPTPATAKSIVKKTVAPPVPQKSRYDLTGAKSVVYRILPDGGNDVVWNSPNVNAFSILPNANGGVYIGTSDKGRIYSVTNDGRETLLLQTDQEQISTLFKGKTDEVLATSSNQGKFFNFGGTESQGVYESTVLDANTTADWGRIWWRSTGMVGVQTRSGNTEQPDETWSEWSKGAIDGKGLTVESPKARFLQWRAILYDVSPADGARASVNEVNVSYLPRNIAPEILSIEIMPTNVALLPNPPFQIDPNIATSGLDPQIFGIVIPPAVPRKVYQRGATALQWRAEDRNNDTLTYDVFYRELGETRFKLLRENMPETFLTVDGLALTDGKYIFKIIASDATSNPANQALTGEKISEPVEIDNTAPTVTAIGTPTTTNGKTRITFEAADTASFISKAEYSINGGDWQNVYSDDGISDSPRERYTVEIAPKEAGEYTVSLRVFDANGNASSARVVVKK